MAQLDICFQMGMRAGVWSQEGPGCHLEGLESDWECHWDVFAWHSCIGSCPRGRHWPSVVLFLRAPPPPPPSSSSPLRLLVILEAEIGSQKVL